MGYKVFGCDLIPERIALANKMGIETFDFSQEVDAVFMTSGADKYPNNEIYYKELTVLGSYSPSPADLKDSYELLTSGRVNVKDLTTVHPLERVQEAFEDTMSNKIFKAYIKISD